MKHYSHRVNAFTTKRIIEMNMKIGNYNFEGPFASSSDLKNESGVYAILGINSGNKRTVVNVGETSQSIKSALWSEII